LAGVVGILAVVIPFLNAFPWTLEKLEKRDIVKPVDVIVILEGSIHERIRHAFDLAESGYAEVLYYPNPFYEQNRDYLRARTEEAGDTLQVFTGPGADSTYEEAVLTVEFCRERGYTSLILVTSAFHSYRAWWVFHRVMPGMEIISAPVPYKRPWKREEGIDNDHRHVRFADSERKKFLF
jgi:uncharacterized SAM-binding protein YcdF (DUF218 family)